MIIKKLKVGLLTIVAVCLPGLSGAHDKCDSLANATTAGGVFWAPIAGFQVGYYLAKAVDEATSSNTSAQGQYNFANCSLNEDFTRDRYQAILEIAQEEFGQALGDDDFQMYGLWDMAMQLHTLSYDFNQSVADWQRAREKVRDARLQGDTGGAESARQEQDRAHALAVDAFMLYDEHHRDLANEAERIADSLPSTEKVRPQSERLLRVEEVEEAAKQWIGNGFPKFELAAFGLRCVNQESIQGLLGPALRFVDGEDGIPSDAFINDEILKSPTTLYKAIAEAFAGDVRDNLPKNVFPPGFALNKPIPLPDQDIDVIADMTIQTVNEEEWVERHGLVPGTNSQVEFMLDRRTEIIRELEDRIVFYDPWQWHWIVGRPWDWLWGFEIEVVPGIPGPGPVFDQLRIVAPVLQQFNEPEDMVMGLEQGSEFVMELNYPPGALAEPLANRELPDAQILREAVLSPDGQTVGQFQILDPDKKLLLAADINSFDTNPIHYPVLTQGTTDWVEPNFLEAIKVEHPEVDFSEPSITAFMLDPRLRPVILPNGPILRDPWWWHWLVGRTPWDWLRGFDIFIERVEVIPNPPGPGPWDIIRIVTEFDDPRIDMVMGGQLKVGSRFETQLVFRAGDALARFVEAKRVPTQEAFSQAVSENFERGSFQVFKAGEQEPVVRGTVDEVAMEAIDSDNDGISDFEDNCAEVKNLRQRDTDNDGYGNMCDGDIAKDESGMDDGIVNTRDLGLFREAFGSRQFPDADFNGDGIVNTIDLGLFRSMFGKAPGPSAVGMLHEPVAR